MKGTFAVCFIMVLVASGCHIARRTAGTNHEKRGDELKEEISTLKYSGTQIELLYEGKRETFHASIGIIRDSIIVFSVIPVAGIEAYRIYLKKDSIMLIDRAERKYNILSTERIRQRLGIPADFHTLQSILTNGNFSFGNNMNDTYHIVDEENAEYRIIEYRMKTDGGSDCRQIVYMDRKTDTIRKIIINDPAKGVTIEAKYDQFLVKDHFILPENMNIRVDDKQRSLQLNMHIKKIEINQRIGIIWEIPDGYRFNKM